MRRFSNSCPRANAPIATHGPSLIAVGLVVLLATILEPGLPAVTGMACVALGASIAVVSRFRGSRALRPVIAAHLLIYASLYLLFVGAVYHASAENGAMEMSAVQALDLALSIVPIVAAARISIAAVVGGGDAPAR
jgi:hypothetical protein